MTMLYYNRFCTIEILHKILVDISAHLIINCSQIAVRMLVKRRKVLGYIINQIV